MKLFTTSFIVASGLLLAFVIADGPKCDDFISLFDGYICQYEHSLEHSPSYPWDIFLIVPTHPGNQIKTIRTRDVSDPKIKEIVAKESELINKFSHEDIITIEKETQIGNYIVRLFHKTAVTGFSMAFKDNYWGINEPVIYQKGDFFKKIVDIFAKLEAKKVILSGFTFDHIETLTTSEYDGPILIGMENATFLDGPVQDFGNYHFWDPNRFNPEKSPKTFNFTDNSYSLGVILYSLLTKGKYPFAGENKEEIEKHVGTGIYELPTSLTPAFACLLALLLTADRGQRLVSYEFLELISVAMAKKDETYLEKPIKISNKETLPRELFDAAPEDFQEELKRIRPNLYSGSGTGFDGITSFLSATQMFFVIAGFVIVFLLVFVLYYFLKPANQDADGAHPQNLEKDEKTREEPLQDVKTNANDDNGNFRVETS